MHTMVYRYIAYPQGEKALQSVSAYSFQAMCREVTQTRAFSKYKEQYHTAPLGTGSQASASKWLRPRQFHYEIAQGISRRKRPPRRRKRNLIARLALK